MNTTSIPTQIKPKENEDDSKMTLQEKIWMDEIHKDIQADEKPVTDEDLCLMAKQQGEE